MIKHIWSVLCQSSSIDQIDNTVSMFMALESIAISGAEIPPDGNFVPLNMNIISLWTKENPDESLQGRLRVHILGPSGYEYQPIEMEIDLTKSLFYRGRIFSQVIKWNGEGRYQFFIDYKEGSDENWHRAAEIPFWIEFKLIQSPPKEK